MTARYLPRLIALALVAAAPSPTALAGDVPVPTQRPAADTPAAGEPQTRQDPPAEHRSACPAFLSGRITAQLAPALRDGQCGADSPLALESAAGVAFSGRPLVSCEMATELAAIAEFAREKAREILDGDLAAIITGPGYECRRRNRAASGKLSEHAFANALDIAGFRLADGRQVMIGEDWPRAGQREAGRADDEGASTNDAPAAATPAGRAATPGQEFLAEIHAAACRRFTTVLGPDSNTAHESHLHFDLGCHGRDCRYLICE